MGFPLRVEIAQQVIPTLFCYPGLEVIG
jgi:hypothetical protein